MVKILLDTMAVLELLSSPQYQKLAAALDEGKIHGVISTISLTEMYKIIGTEDERRAREAVTRIVASKLELREVDAVVARRAGELKLHYRMPTADALIAATGMTAGAKHVLTEDEHFQVIKSLIKPIKLKQAERMM
ncbi:MAG: PIN domain-containing protein [Hadesarchaea archaeon]|nr:PIN domain-containing protein [Hadesarchaea archaeon]